jgi:hypothetical protein
MDQQIEETIKSKRPFKYDSLFEKVNENVSVLIALMRDLDLKVKSNITAV